MYRGAYPYLPSGQMRLVETKTLSERGKSNRVTNLIPERNSSTIFLDLLLLTPVASFELLQQKFEDKLLERANYAADWLPSCHPHWLALVDPDFDQKLILREN